MSQLHPKLVKMGIVIDNFVFLRGSCCSLFLRPYLLRTAHGTGKSYSYTKIGNTVTFIIDSPCRHAHCSDEMREELARLAVDCKKQFSVGPEGVE